MICLFTVNGIRLTFFGGGGGGGGGGRNNEDLDFIKVCTVS